MNSGNSKVRVQALGRLMIAAGLLGFGALTLIYDDFGLDWQRLPAWVPARGLLAYAAGTIEVAAAAALLPERTAGLADCSTFRRCCRI
jgi:hypothetical protein